MSTIYWKFKNTKSEFSSITFDSTHVSILDLKRAIIKQKGLLQSAKQPFDLSITNAHTGVEYTDETGPIPRNLAVIVRRLPAARNQHRKLYSPMQNNSIIATADNISKKQLQTISERLNHEFGPALFKDAQQNAAAKQNEVNAVESETMGIIDMMNRRMNSSTTAVGGAAMGGRRPMQRRPMTGGGPRPMGGGGPGGDKRGSYQSQRGDPPPGYVCHRCHVSGHWIQDCPTNGDPKFDKRNNRGGYGGARSHLPVPKPATPEKLAGDTSATTDIPTQQVIVGTKCYQIPTNVYESFNGDHSKIKAYIEISSGTHSFSQSTTTTTAATSKIDSRYKCEICQGYYVDARFTPCCHSTYCNECIRQKITNNPTEIRCPSCEDIFAARLLAKNVRLQEKVDQIVRNRPKHAPISAPPPQPTVVVVPAKRQLAAPLMPQPMVTPAPTTVSSTTPPGATQTIQIRHHASGLQPTVILRHGGDATSSASITATPNTATEAPKVLDTSRFCNPVSAAAVPDMSVVCIECKERGHKYKDCPRVREQAKAVNAQRMPALSPSGSDADDAVKNEQSAPTTVVPPQRVPAVSAVSPSVSVLHNVSQQAMNGIQSMSMAQMKLNSLSMVNNINLRNRQMLTMNNLLMNAALHRVNVNKPRIINSAMNNMNPLSNVNAMNPLLLARTQMNNMNQMPFLQQQQQQRLAMQQRGLNAMPRRPMETGPSPLPAPHGNGNANGNGNAIPSALLTATIDSLRLVMASNDQQKVTAAINEAFVKLGANDAESKRKVLEQLVAASTKDTDNGNDSNSEKSSKHRKKSSKHRKRDRKDRDRKRREKDGDRDRDRDRKRKHRRRDRSGSSSKHKERDRERDRSRERDREKDKDRERRHKKDRHRRKRKKRDRERERDRSSRERESDAGSTSVTTENTAANEETEAVTQTVTETETMKEISPVKTTVNIPDFDVDSPPKKKQRTS